MSKLISLEAENFKRLKAVRIEPNERGITVIAGKNGAGKSTVLDAIQSAIGGKRATPDRPIRDGQEKGVIVAELDDMIVKRTFTQGGGGTLTVTMADGVKAATPQKVLDKLFGALTFDPMAFARMKAGEQMEEVRRVAGLDLSDLESKRDALYDRRRDAKAVLKAKDLRVESFGKVAKVEPVDTAEIALKVRAIRDRADKIEHLEGKKKRMMEDYTSTKERIAALEAQLLQIQESGKEVNKQLSELKAIEPEESEADLTARLESMAEVNAAVRRYEEYKAACQDRDGQTKAVDELENALEATRLEIASRIAAVKLPVSDMAFGDEGLLLNGIPFSQASQSEQIRASVEMGIGANPELRLVLVRDGSLFDAEHLALLAQIAEEHDVQVLVERVGTDGGVGIIIEDGEVRNG